MTQKKLDIHVVAPVHPDFAHFIKRAALAAGVSEDTLLRDALVQSPLGAAFAQSEAVLRTTALGLTQRKHVLIDTRQLGQWATLQEAPPAAPSVSARPERLGPPGPGCSTETDEEKAARLFPPRAHYEGYWCVTNTDLRVMHFTLTENTMHAPQPEVLTQEALDFLGGLLLRRFNDALPKGAPRAHCVFAKSKEDFDATVARRFRVRREKFSCFIHKGYAGTTLIDAPSVLQFTRKSA